MRMVKRLGVLAVSAALLLGLVLPAAAKTQTFTDPVGDVYWLKADGDGQFTSQQPDIASVRASLNKTWLTVAVTLTETATKGWDNLAIAIASRNDGSPDYRVTVNAANGRVTSVGAGNWSSSGDFPDSDVRVAIKGRTVTVNAAIGDRLAYRDAIGLSVSMARYLAKNKSASRIDDFPSRDRAGGRLGPMQFQTVARSSGKVASLKATAVTLTLAKTTIKKSAQPKLRISVKQKLPGLAMIYDGYDDVVAMVRIASGKTKTVNLAKNQRVGAHALKVRFFPDSLKHAASTSKYVVLTVKKK